MMVKEKQLALSAIGRRIKLAREHLQLTQIQLAQQVGYSKGAISQIENGQMSMSFSMLRKMAKALNVPVGFLEFEPVIKDEYLEILFKQFKIFSSHVEPKNINQIKLLVEDDYQRIPKK